MFMIRACLFRIKIKIIMGEHNLEMIFREFYVNQKLICIFL
jgi:hypothetical protein